LLWEQKGEKAAEKAAAEKAAAEKAATEKAAAENSAAEKAAAEKAAEKAAAEKAAAEKAAAEKAAAVKAAAEKAAAKLWPLRRGCLASRHRHPLPAEARGLLVMQCWRPHPSSGPACKPRRTLVCPPSGLL
jgi:hypothetical protein